jgi:hypothetical protein
MKPGSNSVEDHPQLSHSRHPVDGALVGAGSLWVAKNREQCKFAKVITEENFAIITIPNENLNALIS